MKSRKLWDKNICCRSDADYETLLTTREGGQTKKYLIMLVKHIYHFLRRAKGS